MKLIAYVGPKGSGKDSCALIAKKAGLVADKIPFAGPLKRICSNVFDIPLEIFEHPELKENTDKVYELTPTVLGGVLVGMDEYLPASVEDYRACARSFVDHIGVELKSPRHVLQYVGTELIRAFRPDWHCEAAFSPLHLDELGVNTYAVDSVYAVTDCRFLNEYAFLKDKHDTSFHYVLRPKAEEVLLNATHPSELEISNVRNLIDSVIFNIGTLDELATKVVEASNG